MVGGNDKDGLVYYDETQQKFPSSSRESGDLPSWVWSVGTALGVLGILDIAAEGILPGSRGLPVWRVVGEAIGVVLSFTAAASAKP